MTFCLAEPPPPPPGLADGPGFQPPPPDGKRSYLAGLGGVVRIALTGARNGVLRAVRIDLENSVEVEAKDERNMRDIPAGMCYLITRLYVAIV
jgi:hypothetical protein